MNKHDSWVYLNSENNPFDSVKELFPSGFPVRDPFPLMHGKNLDDQTISLWIIDFNRLNNEQFNSIANAIATKCKARILDVIEAAQRTGGFAIRHALVVRLLVGAEGLTRTKEAEIYFEDKDMSCLSAADWEEFVNQQYRDWIDGNKSPDVELYQQEYDFYTEVALFPGFNTDTDTDFD